MSHLLLPLAGNRSVWLALTSNFDANRREFSLLREERDTLSGVWPALPGFRGRRRSNFRTISDAIESPVAS